ncbi:MAG: ferritin-like domain-containing protein [Solirubrobacterales bacterium]
MEKTVIHEILSVAVENEIEAFEFYRSAAGAMKDAGMKSMFEELAAEELKHRDQLSGYLAAGSALPEFADVKDYQVAKTLESPKLSMAMKPADALALAIKNEEEAMNLYAGLAAAAKDDQQRKLFEGLSRMEKGHKAKLEDLYTNAAFPEAW